MSAKYKSPSFLLPNEINTNTNPLNTDGNPATGTGVNSLYSMDFLTTTRIPDITGLGLGTSVDTFSISLWFNKSNMNYGIVFSTYSGSGTYITSGVAINLYTDGTIGFYNGAARTTTSAQYSINTWYNLVVTSDGTTVKMYVNGSQVTLNSTTAVARDFTNVWINSAKYSASDFGIVGKIDEVAIFNRALDSTEISALYDGSGSNIRPSNLMATDLNPIAYYPLGEQAQNSGKLPDTSTNEWQFPNGVLQDYVMDFDGSTDYIDAGSSVGVIGTGVRTFSVWLKTSNTTLTQTVLGTRNYNTDGWVIQIYPNSILFFNVKGGSNKGIYTTAANLTDGNWHHLVIVRAGTGNNKIYVDGVSQTLSTSPFGDENLTDPQSSKNLLIGAGYNTGGVLYRFFDGEMSNLAIWNSDQSANIANIYNNGSPQTTYTVTPQNWWKLNADSVYTPSAPNYTTALDFDSSQSDYVDFGDSDDFSFGDGSTDSPFSVSAWIKVGNTGINRIVNKVDGTNAEWLFSTGTNNRTLVLNLYSSGATTSGPNRGVAGSTSFNSYINQWVHVACSYDGTGGNTAYNGMKLYFNGQLETTTNLAAGTYVAMANTAAPLRIGSDINFTNNHFDGSISNVAVYNSALLPSQVSNLFNFGTPETNISFSPTAWWKLDNTTTGIQDSSGNGHTGTNNGAAQVSSSVAVVPSWKITSALTVPEHNYLNVLNFNNDEVTLSSLSNFVTNNFTASIWVNYETLPASYRGNPMGATNGGGWETGFGFVNNGITGKLMFIVQNWDNNPAGSGGIVNSTTTFTTNKWFHLAGTWDGSTVTFYINGVSQGTATYTGSLDTSDVLSIGTNLSGSGYDIDAILSNAVIFNTALPATGTESVASLYNNGTPPDISSYSSLTGWWKLDSTTITDYSGNGNTGTNNGAEVEVSNLIAGNIPVNGVSTTLPSTALQQSDLQFDSPYSNYSLSFDGTGGYIDCGDSDIFSFGNSTNDSPFSISAWIYMDSTTNFRILAKYDAPNYEYQFDVGGSSNLRFFIFDGTSYRARIGSTLSINQWYHVVATYNGVGNTNAENGIKIYVDGVEITGTTDSNGSYTAMHNTTAPVYIGRIASSYANGKIDETSIFNYSLSEAQVLEIYNNGRPKDLTTFSGTAPISWWRLGENAYFQDSTLVLPNSIVGAPNGEASTNNLEMISADAPGTYANGIWGRFRYLRSV